MNSIGNSRGQSLVQALVSMGVLAIAIFGFMTLMSRQSTETQALSEKLASLEIQRSVTSILSRGDACDAMFSLPNFAPGATLPDLSTVTPANPYILNLKSIGGPTAARIIASVGEKASPLSNSLALKQEGVQLVMTGATTGELKVRFDESKLARPLRDLSFPMSFSVSDGAIHCTGGGDSAGSGDLCGLFVTTASGSTTANVRCHGFTPRMVTVTCPPNSGSNGTGGMGSSGGGCTPTTKMSYCPDEYKLTAVWAGVNGAHTEYTNGYISDSNPSGPIPTVIYDTSTVSTCVRE